MHSTEEVGQRSEEVNTALKTRYKNFVRHEGKYGNYRCGRVPVTGSQKPHRKIMMLLHRSAPGVREAREQERKEKWTAVPAWHRTTHPNVLFQKKSDKSSLPTPRVLLPSKGSSTSSSICLSVPSFMSFSVKISDGTSSLTVSPSSSDFASHLSHGNVTVSEPWSKHHRGNLFKTTWTQASISPLKTLRHASKDFQLTYVCLCV